MLAFYTKYAPYLLGVFLLALVLKNLRYPFSSELLICSCGLLATVNVLVGSSIPKEPVTATNFFKRLSYYTTAVGLVSVLFQMQHWPNANEMSIVYFGSIVVLLIFALVKKINIQSELSFSEISLLLGTAVLLLRYYLD